jgi:ribosomal protein S18 acetylase RimI-like enzyme
MLRMGLVEELGDLALATRLRRLADRLQQDVSQVYAEQEVAVRARWFPLLAALAREAPRSISELARDLGLTHTAINQIASEMSHARLVVSGAHESDRRQRLLRLSRAGERAVARLRPLWDEIRAATSELAAESGHDVIGVIAAVEAKLDERSMAERLRRRLGTDTVEITDLAPAQAGDFRRLNEQWLEELFRVEDADRAVLDDPLGTVVARGGAVLVATASGRVVGTVALLRRGAEMVELAKMAVAPGSRRRGIGSRLAEAALARARALGARRVVLLTSPKLTAANALYRSLGFVKCGRGSAPLPRYTRASFAMELIPDTPDSSRRKT